METLKINEQYLIEAVEAYKENGDTESFIHYGGKWITMTSGKRAFLTEDELIELFLIFQQKAKNCLDLFHKGNYSSFIPFFNTYVKNLEKNLLRKIRNKEQEFSVLMDDFPQPVVHTSTRLAENTVLLYNSVYKLKAFERILLFLKFEIPLSYRDEIYLYDELIARNLSPAQFGRFYDEKTEDSRIRTAKYTSCTIRKRMEAYTRRTSKNRIAHTAITYNDISKAFQIPRHQVVRTFEKIFLFLKEDLLNQGIRLLYDKKNLT